ncbi:hypothetical protein BRADI_4g17300v3 [Brachypodium distachyon]|uniref:GRF-type domain-containing protein n=1 Tax=Brachypodium distachyon TaxID=15368 RepID=I1ILG1_BRADI|nr:hypothetical protein BRADI_4g17300v3 [Brachypodium distachyon]
MKRGRKGAAPAPSTELPTCVLPLVTCPCCRVRRIVRLVSKSEQNPSRVFYKCPNNRIGTGGCKFFCWEDGEDSYLDYLSSIGMMIPSTYLGGEIEEEEQKEELHEEQKVELKMQKQQQLKMENSEIKLLLEKMDALVVICRMALCAFVVFVALLLYVLAQK